MNGPAKTTDHPETTTEVTCAKCEHVNPHGRSVCERCGAHLHVVCHHCGHRNARSRTHCKECGHKLHRSRLKRLTRAVFGKDTKGLQALLLIVAILAGVAVIIFFAEFELPRF